eukprot:366083-Chlamydomonas_euryale.AAC.15
MHGGKRVWGECEGSPAHALHTKPVALRAAAQHTTHGPPRAVAPCPPRRAPPIARRLTRMDARRMSGHKRRAAEVRVRKQRVKLVRCSVPYGVSSSLLRHPHAMCRANVRPRPKSPEPARRWRALLVARRNGPKRLPRRSVVVRGAARAGARRFGAAALSIVDR